MARKQQCLGKWIFLFYVDFTFDKETVDLKVLAFSNEIPM